MKYIRILTKDDNDEQSYALLIKPWMETMHKFLKKLFKILAVISVIVSAIIGFIYVKYSNFDGYCDEVGRALTEEELIQRGVRKDIYEDNPYCCYTVRKPWFQTDIETFINRLFGYYIYGLTIYSPTDTDPESPHYDAKYPFDASYASISACGKSRIKFGEHITEREYLKFIQQIKNINIGDNNETRN